MQNEKIKIKNQGFTLLLSLLVISVILSVSFGVFDVMTKELKLSGLGRESQIAFYAADAGIECAYFWDIKKKEFDDAIKNDRGFSIKCAGKDMVGGISGNGSLSEPYTLNFNFDMGEDATQKCAEVTVGKVITQEDGFKKTTTTIQSKGYNYWCKSSSPHKVERAIRVVSTKTEKI